MYGPMISDIDVVVTSFTGRVKFAVSVDATPTKEVAHWFSYDRHILIKKSDPNYKNDGTYFVLVYSDDLMSAHTTSEESTYTIKWNTANTMNVLSDWLSQNGRTSVQEYDYYKYLVSPDQLEDDIQISLTPLSGDPNIVISWDYEN